MSGQRIDVGLLLALFVHFCIAGQVMGQTEPAGANAYMRPQEAPPSQGGMVPMHPSGGTPSRATDAPGSRSPARLGTSGDRKLEPAPPPTNLRKPSKGTVISSASDAAVVSEPSQGRPIFVKQGDTFILILRVSEKVSGDVGFFLSHAREPNVRVPLKPTTPPAFSEDYCTLVLQTPQMTEPGLYDIEIRAAAGAFYSRRSVRIVDQFKSRFRFVHLSDMNIGDLTAPEFDDTLPREINILAPEFIVATGDFTEWARARDDASSWSRVLGFFEQFDAPVYMLCGEHDHEASFIRHVANKPIGTIDYGDYHGLLLLDHPGNPIEQDHGQIQWIETDLKRNRDRRFNFICANSDELGLIDVWRETGNVSRLVSDYRVRLILTGGASDWDFREFSNKLSGLSGLQYVRTHASSTSLRDRATGVSHYRVIEVNGDRIEYIYPNDAVAENLQHSIPSGRLRAFYEGPNDGSSARVVVTVQNALNQSFKDARLWLRVAKTGRQQPSVSTGQIVQAIDLGSYWACDVSVDLPDKGAVRVAATSERAGIPAALPIDVALSGPRDWPFMAQSTSFGLSYFESQTAASLRFTNTSNGRQTFWPVIRLNGQHIGLDPKVCARLPVTIDGGKSMDIPLVLQVRRVSAGPHELQVYFLEDPLCRLQRFDVTMGVGQGIAGVMDAGD